MGTSTEGRVDLCGRLSAARAVAASCSQPLGGRR